LPTAGTGKLTTISLWETYEDAQAIEASAAQLRAETGASLGTGTLAVDIYEVAMAA